MKRTRLWEQWAAGHPVDKAMALEATYRQQHNLDPSQTSGGGTLTVNNQYNGFNPTPQVKDQIRAASNTTASAQVHGGAGVPA